MNRNYFVIIEAKKSVNEFNEIQPTLYTVFENDIIVIQTTNFAEALQAYLNRVA